jgi:hypothetical protein
MSANKQTASKKVAKKASSTNDQKKTQKAVVAPVVAPVAVPEPVAAVVAPVVAVVAPVVAAVAEVKPVKKVAGAKKAVAKKPVAKKAGAKKAGAKKVTQKGKSTVTKKATTVKKEAAKKEVKVEGDEEGSKTRYFKVIVDGEEAHGRFSGSKPKQAANKALTSILKVRKAGGGNTTEQVKFSIIECTRNSKHKTYNYIGERVQLDNPIKVTIGSGDAAKVIEYKFGNRVMKDKTVVLA